MLSNITSIPFNKKMGMPFTMNFASISETIDQETIDDMDYNPKQQLSNISAASKGAPSTCTRQSGTTRPKSYIGMTKDPDTDTQQDD